MNKIALYHGSNEIIEKPLFGKGKVYNDYGQGFYCTEHIELAKGWSCNEGVDGFANKYELDTTGLKILNLSAEEYTILHWLALLIKNRRFRVSTPVMRRGVQWLKEQFLTFSSKKSPTSKAGDELRLTLDKVMDTCYTKISRSKRKVDI